MNALQLLWLCVFVGMVVLLIIRFSPAKVPAWWKNLWGSLLIASGATGLATVFYIVWRLAALVPLSP